MFKIEKTRTIEPDCWQFGEAEKAIAQARTELLAPGDVVTVTSTDSGETLWMGLIGRDGTRHEWSGSDPRQVCVSPPIAQAA